MNDLLPSVVVEGISAAVFEAMLLYVYTDVLPQVGTLAMIRHFLPAPCICSPSPSPPSLFHPSNAPRSPRCGNTRALHPERVALESFCYQVLLQPSRGPQDWASHRSTPCPPIAVHPSPPPPPRALANTIFRLAGTLQNMAGVRRGDVAGPRVRHQRSPGGCTAVLADPPALPVRAPRVIQSPGKSYLSSSQRFTFLSFTNRVHSPAHLFPG